MKVDFVYHIPNQIKTKSGLNPRSGARFLTRGTKMGTVSSIIDIDSKIHPKRIYISRIIKMTAIPESSKEIIIPKRASVKPALYKKLENIHVLSSKKNETFNK